MPIFTNVMDFSQTYDRTKIAMRSNTKAYEYTVAGGAIVQVTDGDYPALTVRGLVYLDGVFYVMDSNGTIYGSDTNNFLSWNALNFISAQSEPDGGVAITKYGQYLIAFGNYTTQFFYNAGNATGSPLSTVQNGDLLIGCAVADSVAQCNNAVYFISQDKVQGQSFGSGFDVVEIKGMNGNSIATPDVRRILNADGCVGSWGAVLSLFGHDLYLLVLPATSISIVYDSDSKFWSYFTVQTAANAVTMTSVTSVLQTDTTGLVTVTKTSHGYSDGDVIVIAGATPSGYNGTWNIRYVDANSFTYVTPSLLTTPATGTITATGYTSSYLPLRSAFQAGTVQVFQDPSTGYLYQFDNTIYTDNGVYIDSHIRTDRFDKGMKQESNSQPKFLPWLDVISDKTSSSTNVYVRWSDDDYKTNSHYRAVDISLDRSRLNRCGNFIRRSFEVRHTSTSAFRFQGFDMGLDQGGE